MEELLNLFKNSPIYILIAILLIILIRTILFDLIKITTDIRKDTLKKDTTYETIHDNSKALNPPLQTYNRTQFLDTSNYTSSARLICINRNLISEYRIKGNIPLVIGRDPELCNYTIDFDRHISRKHALIYRCLDKFYLIDLNSSNGTYINGIKVYGDNQINDGDVIRLANTEFIFRLL